MEDSYTVHRRRKAAARRREKTPEPPKRLTTSEDEEEEEERRARMERMAEDTERMEEMERENRRKRQEEEEAGENARRQETRSERRVSSNLEEDPGAREAANKRVKEEASGSRNADGGEEATSVRKVEEAKGKSEEIGKSEENAKKSDGSKEKVQRENLERDVENINEISKAIEVKKVERRKKKSKERVERRARSSDSSDERSETSPRRTKSPETRVRKRSSGKPKASSAEGDATIKRSSSGHKLEEKVEKRQSRRYSQPTDTDDEPRMKKSETFPQKSPEEVVMKRSSTEIKKQIIPLSNESLIEDFAKAQREYLLRERSILDPDPMDIFQDAQENILRKRRNSVTQTESEPEEYAKPTKKLEGTKGSWFSWLPFFRKQATQEEERKPEEKTQILEKKKEKVATKEELAEKVTLMDFFRAFKDVIAEFRAFVAQNPKETENIRYLRNRCIAELIVIMIYCGLGAFVFRFTEGAFETFYKCGVKRVKRDFLDSLWTYSHNLREDDWKSMARKKLMEFEEQLHTAHEAGVHTYSGQRSWSFLNAIVYCLTVITTIGYGHIFPTTNTGRAITIVYAIFGIPMFLIVLADFGKLFTRGIKFLWAFVRRLYYTGSCRKVRRTVPVQEVMKGVQLVYDFATFRRPSQMNPEDIEEMQRQVQQQPQTVLNLDGNAPDSPGTPALSNFAVDDEFNLPISVAIFILLGYIFVGASLYYLWEDWGFFESFYFVFISMSTIGFGDYVPKHPIYMMCSIVYLVFGLALTSMCINVVQVMLSDSFRQASQKIGATIGFEIAEDDGSVKPAVPPPVEIADVHTTVKESESSEKIAPKAKQEDVDL